MEKEGKKWNNNKAEKTLFNATKTKLKPDWAFDGQTTYLFFNHGYFYLFTDCHTLYLIQADWLL